MCDDSTAVSDSVQLLVFLEALWHAMGAQFGDVLYHQEVRWLSHRKVIKRFCDLRQAMRDFLYSEDRDTQVRLDEKWLSDLAFVDITAPLDVLNAQLQIISQLL